MSKKITVQLDFREDIDIYIKKKLTGTIEYRVVKKSLDARGAPRGKAPKYSYVLEQVDKKCSSSDLLPTKVNTKERPLIVGLGPAGIFAALKFIESGIKPIVVDRGECVAKRTLDITKYWKNGELKSDSNVCFGEGGAGLFSDGKLISRIKSPYVQYVMDKLVEFGAPDDTAYLNAPHLGSNLIRKIIVKITDYLKKEGATILYNSRVDDLLIQDCEVKGVSLADGTKITSSYIILATGHSARDVYNILDKNGVSLSSKDFAVGVRVEHSREFIDRSQYGSFAGDRIGAANYKLSYHNKESDRGCYSFCMCPGGVVLSAGSEQNGLVVNGMSNAGRGGRFSNAAIVVSVKAGVDFRGILGGISFQAKIEERAYQESLRSSSGRELPAQRVEDFLNDKLSCKLPKSSVPSQVFSCELSTLFPSFITEHLKVGLQKFNRNIPGFTKEAVLIAPETRTSSPVKIDRNSERESLNVRGLYPTGEGAGYAGGITSAATDGVASAIAIIKIFANCSD